MKFYVLRVFLVLVCLLIISCRSDSKSPSDQDEKRFDLGVTFPIEDSNIGGGAKSIHVRGSVKSSDSQLEVNSGSVSVRVNGVNAPFLNKRPNEWGVKVPIENGGNQLTIELVENSLVTQSQELNISNDPVMSADTTIWDGGEYSYSESVGADFIVRHSSLTDEVSPFLSREDFIELKACTSFKGLKLSPNGKMLAFSCLLTSDEEGLFVFDIGTRSLRSKYFISSFIQSTNWVDNNLILFSVPKPNFVLLDVQQNSAKEFSLLEEEGVWYSSSFDNDGMTVYIRSLLNSEDECRSFDLNQVISSKADSIEVETESTSLTIPSNVFHISDGNVYSLSPNGFSRVNIKTNETTQLTIDSKGVNEKVIPDWRFGFAVIGHINDESMTIKNYEGLNLFRVDLDTLGVLSVKKPKQLVSEKLFDISLSPTNDQLAIYDFYHHRFSVVDLNTFSMSKSYDFQEIVTDTTFAQYGSIAYDWGNEIIYRSHNQSLTPESDRSEPLLVSIDTKNNTEVSVLSVLETELLNISFSDYHISDVVQTNDPDYLLLSMQAKADLGSFDEFFDSTVISLNVVTKEIEVILFDTGTSGFINTETHLSSFSPELGGVISSSSRGKAWFIPSTEPHAEIKGEASEQFSSPLLLNSWVKHTDLDTQNNRYYISQQLNSDRSVQTVEFDIFSGESRLVGSKDFEYAIPLRRTKFKYNEKMDVLMDYQFGHLIVIDPWSGDRVLKATDG